MKSLIIIVSLICALFPVSTPLQAAHHTSPRLDIETAENELVALINEERLKMGLAPLKIWKELTRCARNHSQNMADGATSFGHDGFEKRAKEIKQHARYKKFGENVAYSYNKKDPLKTAVKGWMNSPPHKKTILGAYEETGIGIAYSKDGSFYVTQLFLTKKR